MKISKKLLLGFLAISAMILVVGYLSLYLYSTVESNKKVELPLEQNLREVEVSLWEAIHAANAYWLSGDQAYEQLYFRQIDDVNNFFNKYTLILNPENNQEVANYASNTNTEHTPSSLLEKDSFFIQKFKKTWEKAQNSGKTLIDNTKKLNLLEKKYFESISVLDNIINFDIQTKLSFEDPRLTEKKQALSEVKISLLEAVHAVNQFINMSVEKTNLKNIYKNRNEEAHFPKLMLTQNDDINQFWSKYTKLADAPWELKAINKFERNWKTAATTGNDLASLFNNTKNQFYDLYEYIDKADKILSNSLQNIIQKKIDNNSSRAESIRAAVIVVIIISFVLAILLGMLLSRSITKPIRELMNASKEMTKGNLDVTVNIKSDDEIGVLGKSFITMIDTLRTQTKTVERRNWLSEGLSELNSILRVAKDYQELGKQVCSFLAKYLDIQIAAFYTASENKFNLAGSYAFSKRKILGELIEFGEGIAGQAAIEKDIISVTDIPENYTRVNSATGSSAPRNIVAVPFIYNNITMGVVEVGSLSELSDHKLDFLKSASEPIAISINNIKNQYDLKKLLNESQSQTEKLQAQAEELQAQQEELKAANEELEEKTEVLQESEEKLKAQQEELQASNEELEEKNSYLEKQKTEISVKNTALENIRLDLEQKAKELAITSKYKSEFLANMSHELRTPLNSLLILSNKLAENKKGNLDERQAESAKIIYKSGQDLLNLINDVLDISKIEAGKMNLNISSVDIFEFKTNIIRNFKHVVEHKKLKLLTDVRPDCPVTVYTDRQRVDQLIKNLLSNAIKFTDNGNISVTFFKPEKNVDLSRSGLNPDEAFGISVKDSGIGIPNNKQLEIFEAFQQADGSTSRKYGGTGLGLSISKELAKLLGGEITLESVEKEGSVFTVYLPIKLNDDILETKEEQTKPANIGQKDISVSVNDKSSANNTTEILNSAIKDDKDNIASSDRIILIIEDNLTFATILYEKCRERGFKAIIAPTGEEGIELVAKYNPEAVILDIMLPGIDGWSVLEILKNDTSRRHIPVHIVSGIDQDLSALKKGAIGFSQKPLSGESIKGIFNNIEGIINRGIKKILLVEDDKVLRMTINKLLKDDNVEISEAATGSDALKELDKNRFDCVILDLGLPDISGFELLNTLKNKKESVPPIIIYTGKDLEPPEIKKLEKYSDSIIIKGVKSEERLIDEVALFLHQVVKNMGEDKRKAIIKLHEKDNIFMDKKILIADDDMRNVFALSGLFEEKGMKVIEAENGEEALKKLNDNSDIDIIIMDIMMPVMDGYDAMKKIRKIDKFVKTPIIALTAKAMPEDRGKCIEAGASDYLAKPVQEDRLFSMMRAWLYR